MIRILMCNSVFHRWGRLLSGLLLLLCLSACDKANRGPLFTASGPAAESCGFASSVLRVSVSGEDEGFIRVPVYRNGTGLKSLKLGIAFDPAGTGSSPDEDWVDTDPNGVFSLTTKNLIFSGDNLISYALVSFTDIAKVHPGRKYVMRLELEGQEKSLQYQRITLTVRRKLTFVKYADCLFSDTCLFEESYECELFKAEEAEVYRLMDPYTEGLEKEGYTENGLTRNPPDYIEFMVDGTGLITYDPFYTGMLVPTPSGALAGAYGYWPGDYIWGKDFSSYNSLNRRVSDKQFVLWPVYCLPDFNHGFLNDGVYQMTITLP